MTGWLTVVTYFVCAALAVAASRRSRGVERGFWRLIAVGMIVLGVNKQLDLQALLAMIGRDAAVAQGWYEQRQIVQRNFVIGLAALGGGGMAFAFVALRSHLGRWSCWGLFAVGMLTMFVLIRAMSFHHIDAFIGWRLGAFRYNAVLELGPLIALGFCAIKAGQRTNRTRESRR